MVWMVPPQKRYPHPNTRNILWMWSYLEKKKCFCRCNLVKDLKRRSFWITWVVLKQMTSALKRERQRAFWVRHKGEDIEGRRQCDHRQRSEWFSCKSRSANNHQKLEEAKDGFPLETPERVQPCQHCECGLLASRTVRTNFSCSQPPSLWSFVRAATRN